MSKVAMDYVIVADKTDIGLGMKVRRFLSKGWQPIGGVSFDSYNRYLQAMVKYKENEE